MKKMLMALTAAIYGFAAAQEFRIDVGSSKGILSRPEFPVKVLLFSRRHG